MKAHLSCIWNLKKIIIKKTKFKWSPDSSGETDHRTQECVGAEILQHALHRLTVHSEGNARRTEVQATADDIILPQQALIGRADPATDASYAWIKGLQLFNVELLLSALLMPDSRNCVTKTMNPLDFPSVHGT